MTEEQVKIKVFECWPEEDPKEIYSLSSDNAAEHRKLLKRLEVLADLLNYIK